MSESDLKIVKPASAIAGTVRVPGDKSISHRAGMLCALASGESTIEGFLKSEDCLNTLKAVERLGAKVDIGDVIKITGTGGKFSESSGVLDMGNSGTGARLIAGLLAGHEFQSTITGDDSLCSRPMKRIKGPLETFGAEIELTGAEGFAPITVKGGSLKGYEYELPVASAQVKSCVLLAGMFADGETVVIEPRATRDHTEKMLIAMGVPLQVDGLKVSVKGSSGSALNLRAGRMVIPGDISSAAFWIAGAACMAGSEVLIKGVGLNPRRTAVLDVVRRMGGDVVVEESGLDSEWGERAGVIRVKGGSLKGATVGGDEIPNLIDELPIVAVMAALADGQTVIKDAGELRVKESDRISVMVEGLRSMGVVVEERDDGMIIEGGADIKGGADIDSHGDHRIAMAFAVLALFGEKSTCINGVECIDTSYPGFWEDMSKLVR